MSTAGTSGSREQHRAASADTKIGFVRYDYERDVRLRNDFFGNP